MKKLLSLLLALSLASVSLTACGDDEKSSSNEVTTTTAATTTTPAVTTTAPVVTTAAPVVTTVPEPAEPAQLEGTDISDRLTATENADSSIYWRTGAWFMGSDNAPMEKPLTIEELSKYEYLNIGYQVTYYEGEFLYLMFKVNHTTDTYTTTDGTEATTRTEYLCPNWMAYGPKEDSNSNRGLTKNGEDIYKQDIDPSGTGILAVPTSVLLAEMKEGDVINQIGLGHDGTIIDVGDDNSYEIYVTGASLSGATGE